MSIGGDVGSDFDRGFTVEYIDKPTPWASMWFRIYSTGGMLFIPDLAVEEVYHVFRAAFYS